MINNSIEIGKVRRTIKKKMGGGRTWLVQSVSMNTIPNSCPDARHVLMIICRRSSVEFVASKIPISPSVASHASMSSRAAAAHASRAALASSLCGSKKSDLPDFPAVSASRLYLPTLNTLVE